MVPKRTQVTKPLVCDLTEGKHRNLIPFKPGQSGNPRGRPKGPVVSSGKISSMSYMKTSQCMARLRSNVCVRKTQQPISALL
jgi:hypothetical protein